MLASSFHAIEAVQTEQLTHTEWLEQRRNGIGGSDVAAICGLSKWRSPYYVYLEKKGEAPHTEPGEAAEWGNRLEPLIAEKFAFEHSEWAITEKKVIYCHLQDWDDGNIPDYYYVQLHWYLYVTGLKWGYFATLIGGNEYREYEVYRDDEMIRELIRICEDFWINHVLTGIAPSIDGSDSTTQLLTRMYPNTSKGEPIPLKVGEIIQPYLHLKQIIKEIQEEINQIENQFNSQLEELSTGYISVYQIKWVNDTRTGVDSKLLKEKYPDIYEQCLKQTAYRQFSLK